MPLLSLTTIMDLNPPPLGRLFLGRGLIPVLKTSLSTVNCQLIKHHLMATQIVRLAVVVRYVPYISLIYNQ